MPQTQLSPVRAAALGLAVRATTRVREDAGMTSAEYAVGTVAACGAGGVLYKVVTSPEIVSLFASLIRKALSFVF